jgi:hypothetical protein
VRPPPWRVLGFCQRPLTRLLSHRFPPCPSLTVSEPTTSEPRAPLRSPPSSRRRRSPIWSAPPPECLLLCQLTLLTTHLRSLARSLSWNGLGPEGGAALAKGLKGNSTLQSLEYATCGSNRLPSVRLPEPVDTPTLSPFPIPRARTVSGEMALEPRGASRSLLSSRRHRSPISSAPLPKSVRFCVSAP